MGGIVKGLGTSTGSTSSTPGNTGTFNPVLGNTGAATSSASLQAQINHLTKMVHMLAKELEAVEKHIKVTPEGIVFQSGVSTVSVLTTGVEFKSTKLRLKSATKDEIRN